MQSGRDAIFVLLCENMLQANRELQITRDIKERIAQHYATCVNGEQCTPDDRFNQTMLSYTRSRSETSRLPGSYWTIKQIPTIWMTAKPPCYTSPSRATPIRSLLQYGSNLDQPDAYGRRAIHLAARDGPVEAPELLIEMGVGIHVRDADGKTPLKYAQESVNMETVAALNVF
ncbi:hypothetical protein F4809DRAFT_66552 [Biscogniauxia mediterranea]|nr:hypothetical protein F4809DRAFT_66552 [Biscogniauxia mediterranea]